MLFTAPDLDEPEQEVLGEIEDLKENLRTNLREPTRWINSLRRAQAALHIQGSNSIEGFRASEDDAAAIDLGEEPLDADEETKLAIRGYCEAMTFVLQISNDEEFAYSAMLLKSLHFMMTSYSLDNRPGQWRAGTVYVQDEKTGETVYEGPPLEELPKLMDEFVASLQDTRTIPLITRAALAHLNLVMIHPFRDGNGRMARCLQTLILAREGVISPTFSSIEEYLGKNTPEYYEVLAETGKGAWHPENDVRPWLRFILLAHLRQARSVRRRVTESERLWIELERLASKRGVPDRAINVLWDATMGYRIRRSVYYAMGVASGEDMTEQTATRDLRQLADLGLILPEGEKRGRFYVASKELRSIRQAIIDARDPRDDRNPFVAV